MVFQGSDEVLLNEAVRAAIKKALGDEPADFALAELTEDAFAVDDDYAISPLVDAAQTPPMLTERRVVVGHHLARFSTADSVAPLVRYLEDPLPSTSLVLVWNKGPKLTKRVGGIPKKLTEALSAANAQIIKTDVGTGRAANEWINDRLKAAAVDLDRGASSLIAEHLGEDRNRLGGILSSLESTFGPGAKVGADDVRPFLGQAGGVPPWDLTDAMARADIAGSLDVLRRMVGAGERHPLAVLATLHTHYGRMMRLDGAAVGNDKDAAALLGMKGSTFPAKKALEQTRRMGSDNIRQAVGLLADADLDLRGRSGIDGRTVLEVLVARLARLSR